MLVSHRYRFIFVKTKKSAGSSVELAFEPYARPESWVPPSGELDFPTLEMVSEAGIVGARSPEAKKNAKYFDHMPAQTIRREVTPKVWKQYFKFCTIRNPWDKTVSFFHFTHKDLRDAPTKQVIRRFRRWVDSAGRRRGLDKGIYWIDGAPAMDGYIRYHALAADTAAVAARLGIEEVKIGNVHTEHRQRGVPYEEYYDQDARSAVAETYADEIAHFGWTFDNTGPLNISPPLKALA